MAYEQKPGDGVLWTNDRKTSDRHPDHTGSITVHRNLKAGEKVNLAAWMKEGKKGKFLSLRMSDAKQTQQSKQPKDDEWEPPF